MRDGAAFAELERRVSALERLRAPIRRRFRRRSPTSSGETLSSGTGFLVEIGFVVFMSAAGAAVDGNQPLAGAVAFGAVAGLLVLGLVVVSRSDLRPRRRLRGRRSEQRREQASDR
jgi:membrane associated rhomboid family serine protease